MYRGERGNTRGFRAPKAALVLGSLLGLAACDDQTFMFGGMLGLGGGGSQIEGNQSRPADGLSDADFSSEYIEAGAAERARGGRKGIFSEVSPAGRFRQGLFDEVVASPYTAGVQSMIYWSTLQPGPDTYDWSAVDSLLAKCSTAGKVAALKIMTVNGKMEFDGQGEEFDPADVYVNSATPSWYFEIPGVWMVGGIATPKGHLPFYPVFWDPFYLAKMNQFIAAIASRYDGDPRLAFIRIGGWQVGTNEPSFYAGASEFLVDQLAGYGMEVRFKQNGRLDLRAGDPYTTATIDMINTWRSEFQGTRLAATIHFEEDPESFEEVMNARCAALRLTLLNTGLNEGDHAPARAQFRYFRDTFGCPVGWGGITHFGTRLTQEEIEALPHSLQMEMFMQGIGVEGHPRYGPASHVSYLVVGKDLLNYTAEMAWAAGHLVPSPGGS